MRESILYRVVTDRFVAGVIIRDDRVVLAAPIFRRWKGHSLAELQRWTEEQGGTVTVVAE